MILVKKREPSLDYKLDYVLNKIIELQKRGETSLTTDKIFAVIDSECYIEVEDYDAETGAEYTRLVQVAQNDIEDEQTLQELLDQLFDDNNVKLAGNSQTNVQEYFVPVKGKLFLRDGGYEGLFYRNNSEQIRIGEYHALTKILTVGTIVAAVATSGVFLKEIHMLLKKEHLEFYRKIFPTLVTFEFTFLFVGIMYLAYYIIVDTKPNIFHKPGNR